MQSQVEVCYEFQEGFCCFFTTNSPATCCRHPLVLKKFIIGCTAA